MGGVAVFYPMNHGHLFFPRNFILFGFVLLAVAYRFKELIVVGIKVLDKYEVHKEFRLNVEKLSC